jgi:CheY-like chemotaxis protein
MERARVVVVTTDAERLRQYSAALPAAGIAARATLDVDEAAALVHRHPPDVLVLDHGLPRLVSFQLYGIVREDGGEPRVRVVFVGQDGATDSDDHFLPGEPSPSAVVELVSNLAARADAVTAHLPRPAPTVGDQQVPARRLDIVMIRVGLVLLILGAILFLVRASWSPPALTPPTVVPATPTRASHLVPGPIARLGVVGAAASTVSSVD